MDVATTSRTECLRTYVSSDLLRHLDHLAERNGLSRSSQVRTLLLDALRTRGDASDDRTADG